MNRTDYLVIAISVYFGIAGYSHGMLNAINSAMLPAVFYLLGASR